MNAIALSTGAIFGTGLAVLWLPSVCHDVAQGVGNVVRRTKHLASEHTGRRHARDLALLGWTPSDLVVRQLIGGIVGTFVMVALSTLVLGGPGIALALGIGPILGALMPISRMRSLAKTRRRSFVHAFSAYLDLTNVLLAGGAGIETALIAAADAGDGWAFESIRHCLARARLSRRSPWSELRLVGERWGIIEVVEVAGSMSLSGEHGARIRSSLASRADSMRSRQIAEVESMSQSATERMGVPVMLLFVGFMVLLGYPALSQVVMNM